MKVELLDKIGGWNPQLYREIKGKLRWHKIIVAVVVSFLFQALILWVETSDYNGTARLNWQEVFYILNWGLPMLASAIGVYQLSHNLCQEKQRGTLSFLCLSPQPSEKILLGKLLGVPLLLYFAIALAFPLHFTAALMAIGSLSVGEILLFLGKLYLVWIGIVSIFYNLAMLMALASDPKQKLKALPAVSSGLSLIVTSIAIVLILPFFPIFYPVSEGGNWNWFFLPESFAYPWLLGTLFAINFLIWNLTNYGFRNPNSSAIAKGQNYWFVVCLHVWFLGFALPILVLHSPYGGKIVWGIYLLAIPIAHLRFLSLLCSSSDNIDPKSTQSREVSAVEQPLPTSNIVINIFALQLNFIIFLILWIPWLVLSSYLK